MSVIAFYGGSFNPPTIAHQAIIDHLLKQPVFSKVIVKPCGTRQDKPQLKDTLEQRCERVYKDLSRPNAHYLLDVSAMRQAMIPTIVEWQNLKLTNPDRQIYFVAGTDLFIEQADGTCQIQNWVEGQNLFEQAFFYIYPRPIKGKCLYPPNHLKVTDFDPIAISSSEIRKKESQPKVDTSKPS